MMERDLQTTVMGGKQIEVQYLDGKKQAVTVKVLSIRQLHESAQLAGDEAALAELYCGQDNGWADKLKPEEVLRIVEEGDALNFTAIEALRKRRLSEAKRARKYIDDMEQAGMVLDRNSGTRSSTPQLS